jgi:uncharacterized protein YoxC
MSSKQIVCAGCLNTIKSKQLLKCCKCTKTYDLLCAGVSEKRYSSFYGPGSERKQTWICPECINKKPKSDTTNTPVRAMPVQDEISPDALTDNSPHDNVTLRGGRNRNECLDADLTSLIRREIRAAIRVEMAPINEKLQELQNSVHYISNQYDELIKSTNKIILDHKNMQVECEQLRTTVSGMSQRIDQLEQYLRNNNLEIQGVPEHKNENIVSIVNKIANVVSLKLEDTDILNSTRVAHKNKDIKTPRAIVVQLRSVRCRDEFYSAVSRYNKKHPKSKLGSSLLGLSGPSVPIYVSEHLSPTNKSLHAAARARAKELTYKFVWVRNGRIFMRKDETSPFVHIKSQKTFRLIEVVICLIFYLYFTIITVYFYFYNGKVVNLLSKY